MVTQQIKDYLNQQHVQFSSILHSPAYTAQQIAQSGHINGSEMAKTVIVKNREGRLLMIVLTANDKINFRHLEDEMNSGALELATERDFASQFADCEIGAMPPFGNLYNMDVYVDEVLSHDKEIAFNAGSHSELIRMQFEDFRKLVNPKIIHAA